MIRAWKRRIEERRQVPYIFGRRSVRALGQREVIAAESRRDSAVVAACSGGLCTGVLERNQARDSSALKRESDDLPESNELDLVIAACESAGGAERGLKMLLVLDQFEQWLQSHPDDHDGELVRALVNATGWAASVSCSCETISGWPRPGS